MIKDGRRDNEGFLVGEGHKLDLFGECNGHAQNKRFGRLGSLKRTKKITMYHLIGGGALRERRHQRRRQPRRFSKLALVTLLNVQLNILVHARPIVQLQNSFFRFEDAVDN